MLKVVGKYLHQVSDFNFNGLKGDEVYLLRFFWVDKMRHMNLRAFYNDGESASISSIIYLTPDQLLNDWSLIGEVSVDEYSGGIIHACELGFMNMINRDMKLNKILDV